MKMKYPEYEKTEELSSYDKFNVGDYFIIISKPSSWNSLACNKCPLDYKGGKRKPKISYPYKGKIKRILKKTEAYSKRPFVSIGMTEGKFGWSLEALLEENLIIHDVKKQRKEKINKINAETETTTL